MQINLHKQYELSGLQQFKIDTIFTPNEKIIDVTMRGSDKKSGSMNGKRKINHPRKDSYLSSTSTAANGSSSDQLNSSSEDGSGARMKECSGLKVMKHGNFTKVMHDRWQQSNGNIPAVDRRDIAEEHPVFNNGKKTAPEHQHHPEFTQISYLRLRSLEEAFLLRNYFDTKERLPLGKKLANFATTASGRECPALREEDRCYGIQKIFDLHLRKGYKVETLFIAAGIFDRYINMLGPKNFPRPQVLHLATICVLMSAKLEQPISPSFTRMINLLPEDEKKHVTK